MVDVDVVPERTVLLNIDMQNLFVEGYQTSAPDGIATLDRINRLAAVCREAGLLVIHASHVLRPDGSNMGILGDLYPEVRAGLLSKDGTPTALHPALVVDPRDLLLEKPRYGAFHGTDLELILRTRGIDKVIIAGIATNICCDTTAREAMVRDFRVFFLSDGTATSGSAEISPEAQQRATLATINDAIGQVLSVDETIQQIERSGGREPDLGSGNAQGFDSC